MPRLLTIPYTAGHAADRAVLGKTDKHQRTQLC